MAAIMRFFSLFMLMFASATLHAEIKVAVASNFKTTLIEITKVYKLETGKTVLISSASTGTLFNQIKHGAPFDLFLSADSERAKRLEGSTSGITGSRFTYAQGRLAFWQPKATKQVTKLTLQREEAKLAIANPKLAPYGLATKQALISLRLWQKNKYIQGANIAQTYQFIETGNIKSGFVAYVLVKNKPAMQYYLLPTSLHEPIKQQGVILSRSTHLAETNAFIHFLTSPKIKKLIQEKGYL